MSSMRRLRTVSLLEGMSFLMLLCVAMPLKYVLGMPIAVKIAGWLHGVLFLALGWLLSSAYGERRLDAGLAIKVFIAALLPFGPFVMDRRLKAVEAALDGDAPAATAHR